MFEPSITVVGNVADAPTLRTLPSSGVTVADFRVAVTPRRKDAAGLWTDQETLWFGVSAWRQLGEHAASSIKKGDRVVINGTLSSDTWTAENGQVRSGLKVNARSVGLELSRGTASYVKAPPLVTNADPGSFSTVTGEVFDEEAEAVGELEETDVRADLQSDRREEAMAVA